MSALSNFLRSFRGETDVIVLINTVSLNTYLDNIIIVNF